MLFLKEAIESAAARGYKWSEVEDLPENKYNKITANEYCRESITMSEFIEVLNNNAPPGIVIKEISKSNKDIIIEILSPFYSNKEYLRYSTKIPINTNVHKESISLNIDYKTAIDKVIEIFKKDVSVFNVVANEFIILLHTAPENVIVPLRSYISISLQTLPAEYIPDSYFKTENNPLIFAPAANKRQCCNIL